jgi:hypothetical protein
MADLDDARRQRRATADRLLDALAEQGRALDRLQAEVTQGRAARARARELVEDAGGHEPDTVFGSWLDTDDRIAQRLEAYIRSERERTEAVRAHIAATELLLFELQPELGDPRADG